MKNTLYDYKVSPSVVPADKVSKITIKGNGKNYHNFYDDVLYEVKICAKEYRDIPLNPETFGWFGNYKTIKAYPKNGILEFEYDFKYEQEWEIVVKALPNDEQKNEQYMHYRNKWTLGDFLYGITFNIYSLKPDLYERLPYCGDMHLHSDYSDGREKPEVTLSNTRKYGKDYASITDHYYFHSSVIAKKQIEKLKTDFTAFVGEEVHIDAHETFHIVNFNPNYSVNEIINNDIEGFCKRIKDGAKEIVGETGDNALLLSGYKLITDEVKKSGGMAIFPHPYWYYQNSYNCPTIIAEEVIKRGYFDAFEVLGGVMPEHNNIQVAFYNDLRAEGYKIPIVGSTDCHLTNERYVDFCDVGRTVVFAKSTDDILNSIKDLYSVAVETRKYEDERVYGSVRLVKYTQFLLKNYFPKHNMLCNASGTLMVEYFKGSEYLKEAIEKAEEKIIEYKNEFFGR